METNVVTTVDGSINTLTSLFEIDAMMSILLQHWKTLPEESAMAKQAALTYTKLLQRKRALASLPVKPEWQGLVDEVISSPLLKVSLSHLPIAFYAVPSETRTYKAVIDQLFAHRLEAVADAYHAKVEPEAWSIIKDRAYLHLEGKRKALQAGALGKIFLAKFAALKAEAGEAESIEQATDPLSAPWVCLSSSSPAPGASSLKPKKPKKLAWVSVTDAQVQVPTTYPDQAGWGQPVVQISKKLDGMLAKYIKKEQQNWAACGIDALDVLLRHNFLQALIAPGFSNDGVSQGAVILATTPRIHAGFRDGQAGLSLWQEGEAAL